MLDSESTFRYEDNETYTTPFRKLAENAANISLGYDKGQWDIRLAMNYRSEYLDWLADEEDDIDKVSVDNSRFVDEHIQWDLTAKYKATENITVKFEAINIGDRPEFYYWGRDTRLSQYDEYGSSYSLGFTYKL
jgi:outer membrane receptor protein involved in Fe transport